MSGISHRCPPLVLPGRNVKMTCAAGSSMAVAYPGVREWPALIAPGCASLERKYALNCNGGMMRIPGQYLRPLGEPWPRHAVLLVDHRALLGDWVNHIDHVSWAFAMLELRLPFEELPSEYNFPTPLSRRIPAGAHVRPVVLHDHRKINIRGRIRRTGVHEVDGAIRQAIRHLSNGTLLSRMVRAGCCISGKGGGICRGGRSVRAHRMRLFR